MDYKKIYESSSKELETVRVQKAQVNDKLKALAEELHINMDSDVEAQIESLTKQFKEEQAKVEVDLKRLDAELKELENV